MVLWDVSPSPSWCAGFLNKDTIPCPNTTLLDLLACHMASSMSLDSVTITPLGQSYCTGVGVALLSLNCGGLFMTPWTAV